MTHAFVQLCVNPTPLRIKLAEYYIAIRNKLASFRGPKEKGSEPAIAETRHRFPLALICALVYTDGDYYFGILRIRRLLPTVGIICL